MSAAGVADESTVAGSEVGVSCVLSTGSSERSKSRLGVGVAGTTTTTRTGVWRCGRRARTGSCGAYGVTTEPGGMEAVTGVGVGDVTGLGDACEAALSGRARRRGGAMG